MILGDSGVQANTWGEGEEQNKTLYYTHQFSIEFLGDRSESLETLFSILAKDRATPELTQRTTEN